MRLGIMQPYFAPGLGYFDLIRTCDQWVVFDTAQYRRKSWMNRNRILHPKSGWQYVSARTGKTHLGTAIRDIELDQESDWRGLLIRQLRHYHRAAPYYDQTVALVRESLDAEKTSLPRLSVHLLAAFCHRLSIPFAPQFFSEMDLEIGPVAHPGQWALRISEAMGATEYVNPPGGRGIFVAQEFRELGIELEIREFVDLEYATPGYTFLPGLSIIDVSMWCSPEHVREHLEKLDDR